MTLRTAAARLSAVALLLASAATALPAHAAQVRLKDLAEVQGMRENDLFGYGLVVGLAGTGDTERVFFTSQSVSSMLGRLGIRIDPRQVHARNVAAVMVTARLPTFARPGAKLDVTVGAMGDARSLAGGTLLVTPLTAADGAVYALAQGSVQVGGYEASSYGSMLRKNQPNSGSVPSGALVEKAVTPNLGTEKLLLGLKQPDFTNASRVAAAVNAAVGDGTAKALDPAAVEVTIPEAFKENAVGLMAKLEEIQLDADQRAKVVVSERTGTVVAGERVRLRPAMVAQGGLQVSIATQTAVSQPAPFARVGNTVARPNSTLQATEGGRNAVSLPAASTVEELTKALNALGAAPRDLVSILHALKAAGALDADLEVI